MTELNGYGEELPVVWHDVGVAHCQVCGRLLLRQVWRFSDPVRGDIVACGSDCEKLWIDYLGPRLESLASSK